MQAQITGQYQGSYGKTSTLIVTKFLFFLPFFPAIYSIINNQDINQIYDNYTQLHLTNMKSKIKMALDNK